VTTSRHGVVVGPVAPEMARPTQMETPQEGMAQKI